MWPAVVPVSQSDVSSLDGLLTEALKKRLDFFISAGRVADRSQSENSFYLPASTRQPMGYIRRDSTGVSLSSEEAAYVPGFLLTELGRGICRRGLVMQLHIGALRNNSS